jgi:hypothetical protein
MIALAASWGVCRSALSYETLFPNARNLIGLARRCGWTDARTSRKFDSQKVQHCANRPLIILAERFILHVERFDSDPSEEIVPDFLLPFSFLQ